MQMYLFCKCSCLISRNYLLLVLKKFCRELHLLFFTQLWEKIPTIPYFPFIKLFPHHIPSPLSFQLTIHLSSFRASLPLCALKWGLDSLPQFSPCLFGCHSYSSLISLQNTSLPPFTLSALPLLPTTGPYTKIIMCQEVTFHCSLWHFPLSSPPLCLCFLCLSVSACLSLFLPVCLSFSTGSGMMGFCRKGVLMEPWPSLHYLWTTTATHTHTQP